MRTRRLFNTYRETGDAEIRDEIFACYENLVVFSARQYVGRGVDYDDLYQEGCLGLLAAIDRFDVSRGVRFSTFAPYYIKGHILDYFRSKAWPCSVPREYKELSLRIRDLSNELGHDPTVQEIVERFGIPAKKATAAIAATKVWEPAHLYDVNAADDFNHAALDSVSWRDPDVESVPDRLSVQLAIAWELSPEEADVFRLYYYDDLSQREIAEMLGTYQMMVSRLLRKGTDKLERVLKKAS